MKLKLNRRPVGPSGRPVNPARPLAGIRIRRLGVRIPPGSVYRDGKPQAIPVRTGAGRHPTCSELCVSRSRVGPLARNLRSHPPLNATAASTKTTMAYAVTQMRCGMIEERSPENTALAASRPCLLYTSDAADEED